MKNIKSHFWYNKSQRNGVLFLLIIIVLLQVVYFSLDSFYKSDDASFLNSEEEIVLQSKIDSLKKVKSNAKSKIYPFNPNYISDYKGYKLGMSIEEIDRLHQFREKNKYVNSKKEFQSVTKVNDSLLASISPYFKFPDWVTKKEKSFSKSQKKYKEAISAPIIERVSTTDINLATIEDFILVKGIAEKRANLIVNYRKKLQGYTYKYQLNEVWGMPPEVVEELLTVFKIKNKPIIKKVNVNIASFKEVLKTPYVDYELCKKIFDFRDEVAELQDISELKKIQDFPLNKYDRIVLYLEAR